MNGLVSDNCMNPRARNESATIAMSTSRSCIRLGYTIDGDVSQCADLMEDLLDVVHGGDRGVGLGVLGETNETESTTAASISVLDDDLSC
jgi:hypothetical protein